MSVAHPRLQLRPYQIEAVEAVLGALAAGTQRPAVVLPTGAGKTVVFSDLIERWREAVRRIARQRLRRVLVLAHRDELIQQAAAKIRMGAPSSLVGIFNAERKESRADVVVASVQTLIRNLARLDDVGLIIVDECHHAVAKTYLDILKYYGAFNETRWQPKCSAVGFTATMGRGDKLALGDVWQDVVYRRDIAEMVRDGYLVRPTGKRVFVPDLDLRKVRRSRGDYSEKGLGEALEGSLAPELVAKAWMEHAATEQGILFAPTVSAAETMADALREQGPRVALVHGAMPPAERARALEDFRQGATQILANCMVLTEGTDLPMASVAGIARPTTNQGLYVQMVGRVLRLHPGKGRALVLDVVGASAKHALSSPVELFGEEVELEQHPCEHCGTLKRHEPGCPYAAESDELLGLMEEGEELGEGGGTGDQVYLDGELETVEVDLFHGSESAWLRTFAGVWFLQAGERYIAILGSDKPGMWDVLWMGKDFYTGGSGWIARDVPDMSYAMAFAEANVTPEERRLVRRDAGWRKQRASEKQLALARRFRIHLDPGVSGGEAGAAITTFKGSMRIDPHLKPWMIRR